MWPFTTTRIQRALTLFTGTGLAGPLSGRVIVATSVNPLSAPVVETEKTTFAGGWPSFTSPGAALNPEIVATPGSSKTSVYGSFAASEGSSVGFSAKFPRSPSFESSSCAGE